MVKPSSKWNRGPVASRPVDNFTYRYLVPSRLVEKISPVSLYLPSLPVEQLFPYRPVPSSNLPIPSSPAVKTSPYRQILRSKPVPTVPPRHSLLSLLPVKIPLPSKCREYYEYLVLVASTILIVRILIHLLVKRCQAVCACDGRPLRRNN